MTTPVVTPVSGMDAQITTIGRCAVEVVEKANHHIRQGIAARLNARRGWRQDQKQEFDMARVLYQTAFELVERCATADGEVAGDVARTMVEETIEGSNLPDDFQW